MLSRLYIQNYALIESLELTLGPGLSIITGETGAGKSILLGALSLLLGGRSDIKKARDPQQKIIVEGHFSADTEGLRQMFEEQELDWDEAEIVLRREVAPSGRSRAFVNDTPVSSAILGSIGAQLVDIHSQHQNLLLGARMFQLSVLDALAGNADTRRAYSDCFSEYASLHRRITTLRSQISNTQQNEEYLRFRLEQLRKLKPRHGEVAELERRQEILSGSASLSEALGSALSTLTAGEGALLSKLGRIKAQLQGVNTTLFEGEKPQGESIPERLETALVELTDISETIADWLERVDSNPALLQKVEERLNQLYDAMRRFSVKDEAALVELHQSLEAEYAALKGEDTQLPALERELKLKGQQLRTLAEELSRTRHAAAEAFASELMNTAIPLGMPNLKFEATLHDGKLTADGKDQPAFMCAFNKNQPLMPIEKIASGGEVSRMMLALKYVVAQRMNLPTIIFDEVDTGVSGEVAARMAMLMQQISARIQVLAITHLPQVAAAGDTHFMVYKQDSEHATHTHIRHLDSEERVLETARMLSGTSIDEAALLNARSLLAHNSRREN